MALNRGLDFMPLDEVLVDLKLPPQALEVPVPRCLLEDRVQARLPSLILPHLTNRAQGIVLTG